MNYESEIIELKRTINELQKALFVDPLTGLSNRIAFYAGLEREWARAKRSSAIISVVFIDVDDFKAANQHYGHDGADRILAEVGTELARFARRPGDMAARPMGDEFCILLPGCDSDKALRVAGMAEKMVIDAAIENKASPTGYATITAGVSTLAAFLEGTPSLLMEQASKNMMYRKQIKKLQVAA